MKRIVISWGSESVQDDGYEESRISIEKMNEIIEKHRNYLKNINNCTDYSIEFTCKDGSELSYDIRSIKRIVIHERNK